MVAPRADGLLLDISDLTVEYRTGRGKIAALSHFSLGVRRGEILAVVGESGCGKSTLGLSIINLLQKPSASIASGQILFKGTDMLKLNGGEMAALRGTEISMIFQDPMSSLDPVYTVGQQLREAINTRKGRGEKRPEQFAVGNPELEYGARARASRLVVPQAPRARRERRYDDDIIQALRAVNISDPEKVVNKYPHELSGGMAQRVMIAQALVERPSLLIADEPTSALDVTIQAQVLKLIKGLRDEIGSSIIFITHDLAVAAQVADRVAVMYAAQLVELSDVKGLFRRPLHPYSEALILSFPKRYKDEGKLDAISGDVPDLRAPPPGCRFNPRCRYAFDRCRAEGPALLDVGDDHRVACFLREKTA
ncbi:MAG: ABC transporter ATP-binding protein [Nitrososphaerales archaeon]|jgi:peptide/nickel transport system ATP-binding protein